MENPADNAWRNYEEHLDEWLHGEPNMYEEFYAWLQECPASVQDLADKVSKGQPLFEGLIEQWFREEPSKESAFWVYAQGVEEAKLTEGPEYEPDDEI